MFHAKCPLILRVDGIVCRLNVVILLTGDSIFFQEFLVSLQLTFRIGPLHTDFLDGSVIDTQIVLCSGYSRISDLLSCQCVCQVRFGLCQTQSELRIFNHEQRVALVYRLVFLKVNLLDEALHPCIDGSDMLFHLCIVCIFHAAQMEKT